jgi:hypothetical protein
MADAAAADVLTNTPAVQRAAVPKVAVLNPATAEEPRPKPTVTHPSNQSPSLATRSAVARERTHSATRADGSRQRKVLVVVRRVGAPYDTKVLRGRIRDGRLIVDSRDRHGIIIR